jgi:large subunit ribosomal protein L21
MTYAIIQFSGKQFLVQPGTKFTVPGTIGQVGDQLKVKEVLLHADKKLNIGQPHTPDTVTCKVIDQAKGKKVRVATYKAKSRYRKVKGHRQNETTIEVVSLSGKSAPKSSAKKSAKSTSPAKPKSTPAKTTKTKAKSSK